MHRLEATARLLLLVCLGAAVLFTIAFQSQSIAFPHQRDYGEAPLLDQALRLASGEPIYRADLTAPPFTVSNYPPLFVGAMAPFTQLFGPAFWYGRLLSSLAAFLTALFLGLVVFEHTRDRAAALITALVFPTFPVVCNWSSLARVDLPALAFATAALWVLARRPAGRWTLISSSALLLAAVLTRQTQLLAAPLAAVTWLSSTTSRRRAASFALLLAGLTLAAFGAIDLVTSGGFRFNVVVANVNEFRVDRMLRLLSGFAREHWIAVCVGFASLALVRRFGHARAMLVPYGLGALVSAAAIGKLGSSLNYTIELCAALSLAAGIAVAWAHKHCERPLVRAAVYGLLVAQTASFTWISIDGDLARLTRQWGARQELDRLQALVASAPGPVLMDELMGTIPLAGKRIQLQPFELTQLARAGRWDEAPLLDAIRRRRFAFVAMSPASARRDTGFWTPAMLRAFEESYEPRAMLAGSLILGPRD